MQHRSIEAIRGAVRELAIDGRAQLFSKHEAVRALLQGGPGYGTLDFPAGGLALYDATRLSVPDSAVDSVSLTELLRSDARDCVSRWSELMLNSEAEQKLVDATIEPPRLCHDPILGALVWCTEKSIALFFESYSSAFRGRRGFTARALLSTRSEVASV